MNTLEHIENITKKDKVISESIIDVFNQDEQKNKENSKLDEELVGCRVYIPKIGLTYRLYSRRVWKKLKELQYLEGSNLPNNKRENQTVIAGHNMWEWMAILGYKNS